MNKITLSGKLAKQYLKKYPKLPILTLAKLMYAENDMHFNSIEHARSLLKQHAGLGGKQTRKNVDPELQRPIVQAPWILLLMSRVMKSDFLWK